MKNFFPKYKFIFFLLNLILIFLYLFPGSILGWVVYDDLNSQPQITRDFIVSSNHVYTFLIVSIIGFSTYKNSIGKLLLSIYLIF